MDAWDAALVMGTRATPGNTAALFGYDYGGASAYFHPAGSYLSTTPYNATVLNGEYLRVAAVMLNHPTCSGTNCTSDAYPYFLLEVRDGGGGYHYSVSFDNNYKYLVLHNTSGSTQTYQARIYMWDWQGLSTDTWGLAWSTY